MWKWGVRECKVKWTGRETPWCPVRDAPIKVRLEIDHSIDDVINDWSWNPTAFGLLRIELESILIRVLVGVGIGCSSSFGMQVLSHVTWPFDDLAKWVPEVSSSVSGSSPPKTAVVPSVGIRNDEIGPCPSTEQWLGGAIFVIWTSSVTSLTLAARTEISVGTQRNRV